MPIHDSESKIQTKILQWLKKNNYWVFKTILCNRNGIMDIIACSPKGMFVGIEVKSSTGQPSRLQSYNIQEVVNRGGIAFIARSVDDVIKNLL